mgnify:FL=1
MIKREKQDKKLDYDWTQENPKRNIFRSFPLYFRGAFRDVFAPKKGYIFCQLSIQFFIH